MNIFRFLGDMSHLFSIIVLLLRLRVARNAQGPFGSIRCNAIPLLCTPTNEYSSGIARRGFNCMEMGLKTSAAAHPTRPKNWGNAKPDSMPDVRRHPRRQTVTASATPLKDGSWNRKESNLLWNTLP